MGVWWHALAKTEWGHRPKPGMSHTGRQLSWFHLHAGWSLSCFGCSVKSYSQRWSEALSPSISLQRFWEFMYNFANMSKWLQSWSFCCLPPLWIIQQPIRTPSPGSLPAERAGLHSIHDTVFPAKLSRRRCCRRRRRHLHLLLLTTLGCCHTLHLPDS